MTPYSGSNPPPATPPNPPPEEMHDEHLAEGDDSPPELAAVKQPAPEERGFWSLRITDALDLAKVLLLAVIAFHVWAPGGRVVPEPGPGTPAAEAAPLPAHSYADTSWLVAIRDTDFATLVDKLCPGEEGFRSHPYEDAHNSIAIGCGTNLTLGGVTQTQAWMLAATGLYYRQQRFRQGWPEFDSVPRAVQLGLTDAAYELGVAGLLSFGDMLAALARGDVTAAVDEIHDSHWYRTEQTRSRAVELVNIIRKAYR